MCVAAEDWRNEVHEGGWCGKYSHNGGILWDLLLGLLGGGFGLVLVGWVI